MADGLGDRYRKERTFPSYASQKFITWYNREAREAQKQYARQVTYFHGCYVNYNYPQLGKDLVKVMNAVGYGVEVMEREKCCGVAKISNRLIKEATRDARRNIECITEAVDRGNAVIGTSSTCIFTIRDEYPHLLNLEVEHIRPHVMLATKFLFELYESGKIKFVFKPDFRRKVAYHTPCHMLKLGWQYYSTELMKLIPGVELVILDSYCCGIAGTYGFKKENYQYSQGIGEPLFDLIREVNPDVVASDCETCKWQIDMSTDYTVINPISLLAEAIDTEQTAMANMGFRAMQ